VANRKRSRAAKDAHRLKRLLGRERELWDAGVERVAGVDEAGVGPLAGPIVAAAVIFPSGEGLKGVDDSKKLSAVQRDERAVEIRAAALAWAVVPVDPGEIDQLNIYQAGLLAMHRAVMRLAPAPQRVLVDGRGTIPDLPMDQESVIGGDAVCHAIAAASILAKCGRDRLMREYDATYPGYGFAAHKGYPTAEHRDAIRRLGPSPIHRRSFTLLPHPRLFD
jgi:ribonuclease HII